MQAQLTGVHTTDAAGKLGWTTLDRVIGIWSSWAVFALGAAYVPTMVAGFVTTGNLNDPLKDPYVAIMEVLIILMAPVIVVLFAVVHTHAPQDRKTLSLSALALVGVLAGITVGVHFVLLTVGRRLDPATLPSYSQWFSWSWPPSVFYSLDIVAWDFFLGLALLLAAPTFGGDRLTGWLRAVLIVSGILCLSGLLGVGVGSAMVRNLGIIGYGAFFPVAALLMALVFRRHSPAHDEAAHFADFMVTTQMRR